MACCCKLGFTEVPLPITKKNDSPYHAQGEYLCKETFPCKLNDVWIIVVLQLILKAIWYLRS